jgi:hypothetical protein
LYYLDHTASVTPGDSLSLAVQRQGPKLTVQLLGCTTTVSAQTPAPPSSHNDDSTSTCSVKAAKFNSNIAAGDGSGVAPLQLQAAARPPWLRPGAGIEDPAVWAVTKCRQLLGQMLQRAPGGKFPPVWNDLAVMQVSNRIVLRYCTQLALRAA